MRGGADGVAHVVQAVKRRDEVISGIREVGRGGDLEGGTVGEPGVGGSLAGEFDRPLVVVETSHAGVRECGGHQLGRGAQAAADVGHPSACGQLFAHPVQRGQPGRDEVSDIAGAEEPLTAGEHVFAVFVPRDAVPGAERVGDLGFVLQAGHGEQERSSHADTVRIDKCEMLGVGQPERPGVGVGGNVAARGLTGQPLAQVAFTCPGAVRQRGGVRGTDLAERAVEAEPVTDDHVAGMHGGTEVGDEPADQVVELVFVYRHGAAPWCWTARGDGANDRDPSGRATARSPPRCGSRLR